MRWTDRQTLNLVLLLLGGALLVVVRDGAYLRYVTASMRWPLVAAGVAVVVLALVDAVRDARSGGGGDTADDGDGHVHAAGPVTWLVALPVLLLLFVAPTPVSPRGADGVLGGSSVSAGGSAPTRGFPPLPPGEAPELGVLDVVRRATLDPGGGIGDRDVTLVATVLRDGGATRLGRVAVTCCAADARLVAVRVTDAASLRRLAPVTDDGWVRAVVRVVPGSAGRETGHVPAVRVVRAEAVDPPENPYDPPRTY